MTIRTTSLFAVLLCCLAAVSQAQRRVLVVDDDGSGPYRTIQAAVDAARDGDVIRVQGGVYGGFTSTKGVSILCEPGAQIFSRSSKPILVTRVPSGRDFVLRGGTKSQALVVQDCPGRVLIESHVMSGFLTRTSIRVVGSADVVLHQVSAIGRPALSCERSNVTVTECTLRGLNAVWPHAPITAGNAIELRGSRVEVAAGSAVGGAGLAFPVTLGPGAAALFASDSTLVVRGDASTKLSAGRQGGTSVPRSALEGSRGSVVLDPRAAVSGSGGAPPVSPRLTLKRKVLSMVVMTGAGPGGVVQGAVHATAGDRVWLFQGIVGGAISLPGFDGVVRLDPRVLFLVAQGVVPSAGRFPHRVAIPNLPGLLGVKFGWQAVTYSAARGLQLTNLAASVHY